MVDVARACGASANFAGSGGAIVGTYASEATFAALRRALEAVGCSVIKPQM
jgi:glucuronokinase